LKDISMPTFLVTTPPATGHLFPALDLALALRARGHRVLVHSAQEAASHVEAVGAELCPYARYQPPEEHIRAMLLSVPTWLRQLPYLLLRLRPLFVECAVELARELSPVLSREAVDCVVADVFGWGAEYAAERRGIPCASLGAAASAADDQGTLMIARHSPAQPLARAAPRLLHAAVDAAVPLRRARAALGLPPRRDGVAEVFRAFASPALNIVPAHRGFYPPDVPMRSRQVFAGPTAYDGGAAARADSFAPPPPGTVLVSTTTTGVDSSLLRRVLEAVAPLGVPVLATAASASDVPTGLGPHVRLERFVPHERVLPGAAALITHGGWGTVGRALLHGVPMLIIPVFGDQHVNARLAAERGLAYHLPLSRATPQAIRERLRALLSDRAVRENAARAAVETQALRSARPELDALEALVSPCR
jgi:MGT family glycosyltransferase